jgi:hypothetical protein
MRSLNGRGIVAAMFGFGIAATAFLFIYWNLHLMPFMPLQKAIVAEFPKSAPRVDGGQRKMHKGSPKILRVVMKVAFDPAETGADTVTELTRYLDRIRVLAEKHVPLAEYEYLDVNLYYPIREKEIREKLIRKRISDWQDVPPEDNRRPATYSSDRTAAE